jgi:hypothetical protein
MPIHHTTRHTTARRWALVVLLLLALLGLLVASLSQRSTTAASPEAAARADRRGDRAPADASDSDAAEDARAAHDPAPELDEAVDDGTDPGDPGEVDFDTDGAGSDPCAAHDLADGQLVVTPDPLVLPSGEMDGELHVRNCGTDAVDWAAATKPSVHLATAAGTLDPGEVFPVELTIDGSQWEPGAIEFKVKVSEPGDSQYVDVHAFRPAVGADMVASDDLSAGPGVGGCGNQCITKAALSTGYGSPDVGLDVATTVPAKVRVYLSTSAPAFTDAGDPWFPGQPPKATSASLVQSWKTSLTGLEATTKYFIIVKATDADGDTAYRHGSFKTITPVQVDGGFALGGEEPGCANGCITKATVTPGDGSDPAKVVVRTHTPAVIQIMLSRKAPTTKDGHPHVEPKDVWHTSGLDHIEAWDDLVHGLQPATTYHGVIVARDANGHADYATGSFTTDGVDVVITIHKVHVSGDGDSSPGNRGELSFKWGVGTPPNLAGYRGEDKVHSGTDVHFSEAHRSYTVYDATGDLPVVRMVGIERDADGRSDFCTAGTGVFMESGSNGGCDWKWTAARSGTVRAGDLAQLPECSHYGVDDAGLDGCLRVESEDHGDDHPRYWFVVSYRYAD